MAQEAIDVILRCDADDPLGVRGMLSSGDAGEASPGGS
jgi:hypothetical protein